MNNSDKILDFCMKFDNDPVISISDYLTVPGRLGITLNYIDVYDAKGSYKQYIIKLDKQQELFFKYLNDNVDTLSKLGVTRVNGSLYKVMTFCYVTEPIKTTKLLAHLTNKDNLAGLLTGKEKPKNIGNFDETYGVSVHSTLYAFQVKTQQSINALFKYKELNAKIPDPVILVFKANGDWYNDPEFGDNMQNQY